MQKRSDSNLSWWKAGGHVRPNDLIVDPKFVTPKSETDRNFLLSAGSPAIDSAIPFPGIKTDVLGKSRTHGKAPDRGAFEHIGNEQLGFQARYAI